MCKGLGTKLQQMHNCYMKYENNTTIALNSAKTTQKGQKLLYTAETKAILPQRYTCLYVLSFLDAHLWTVGSVLWLCPKRRRQGTQGDKVSCRGPTRVWGKCIHTLYAEQQKKEMVVETAQPQPCCWTVKFKQEKRSCRLSKDVGRVK